MKLFIKNMVSLRCKLVVKSALENLKIPYNTIELGEVEIQEFLSKENMEKLKITLDQSRLEILNDQRSILIEQIKNVVIEMVHYSDELPKTKFSVYLKEKLRHDYAHMAIIFSKVNGITIENFILKHKIERAKELIVYDGLTLSEIAWKLHFSSVAHLSNQFKWITGLTPSHFKKLGHKQLIPLEDLLEMQPNHSPVYA
jgi:YesN/AraC family two-component response regulator